jgi:hypothetical protein
MGGRAISGAAMSQRDSGYERKERDSYQTPPWVTHALRSHLGDIKSIWEPACGNGAMVDVFRDWGLTEIHYPDIARGEDFLLMPPRPVSAIISNPPYSHARQFIEHALNLTKSHDGTVAMLLRTDFDHAQTRQHLFGNCKQFSKKLALTRRIIWFDGPKAAPSFNHSWFLWSWKHSGPPTLAYSGA